MRRTAILLVALAALLAVPTGPAATPPRVTQIARLFIATAVRARPSPASPLVGKLAAVRPITSQETAVPVLRTSADGKWLLVPMPGRPLGRQGWIPVANTTTIPSHWLLLVDRRARQATLYRDGHVHRRFPVVVGKPSTPTPSGLFFVEEHVKQAAGSELGPWALATSAFSRVLQEFGGSPGQIALHGRAGPLLADPLGTAASHGCVRFDNRVISELARLLPNGTPIVIR